MLTMILMLTLAYHDLNCTRELIRLMSETTYLFSESGLQGDDLLKQEQRSSFQVTASEARFACSEGDSI